MPGGPSAQFVGLFGLALRLFKLESVDWIHAQLRVSLQTVFGGLRQK
jgi:hypothetical protein